MRSATFDHANRPLPHQLRDHDLVVDVVDLGVEDLEVELKKVQAALPKATWVVMSMPGDGQSHDAALAIENGKIVAYLWNDEPVE